jgi:hypothetical protein
MLEKDLERKFVYLCRGRNLLCYKFSSPAHRGVPDRVIIGPGRILFLELKSLGNTPTALQDREIQRINSCADSPNIQASWCDSLDQARLLINQHFFIG